MYVKERPYPEFEFRKVFFVFFSVKFEFIAHILSFYKILPSVNMQETKIEKRGFNVTATIFRRRLKAGVGSLDWSRIPFGPRRPLEIWIVVGWW